MEYITVQSCTIVYLIWLCFCTYIYMDTFTKADLLSVVSWMVLLRQCGYLFAQQFYR